MTRKCAYCGVTYSVRDYSRCPFKCPGLNSAWATCSARGDLRGLLGMGLTAAGIGIGQIAQNEFMERYYTHWRIGEYVAFGNTKNGKKEKEVSHDKQNANQRTTRPNQSTW